MNNKAVVMKGDTNAIQINNVSVEFLLFFKAIIPRTNAQNTEARYRTISINTNNPDPMNDLKDTNFI